MRENKLAELQAWFERYCAGCPLNEGGECRSKHDCNAHEALGFVPVPEAKPKMENRT